MEFYSFLFALGRFISCLSDHFCPPVLALSTVPSLPADIVDGNLKSVMRIILALAAHFKPSANHRAASGNGRSLTRGTSSHNPLSPIALAQGAAAALASARHDVSQPAHAACLPRYAWLRKHMCDTHVVSAVLCWTNSENLIKICYSYICQSTICLLSAAGGWTWKRACVFVHWFSSMKSDLQMSRFTFTPAGNSLHM